ncbi:MAG: hypothetical protein IJ196_06785 [Prevotella sp.]|nr:hypothetical protein [Prevotella sp.]
MKLRSYFYAILCALAVVTSMTSCSDDDEENDEWKAGSKVDLPRYRAFVLCEGQFGANNSHLFFYNPTAKTVMQDDIYSLQNGQGLGDTANDMIKYDGDIYIVVNNSRLLLRLNGSGVEQARYADFSVLGEPRNMVAVDGKLYVTCYGGYVARFDAKSLALEASVQVDANPEQIVEMGDSLYCVNSGYGSGHTLSAISIKKFDVATSVETLSNPYGIQKSNGRLYISAYGADYSNPVGVYDINTNKTTQIGNAGRVLASGDKLYMIQSTSEDWVSYDKEYKVYDAVTGKVSEWKLSSLPGEMQEGAAVPYFMTINPIDGSLYIGMTDYYSSGTIYYFDANDNYQGNFTVPGVNPNSMIFLAK